MRRTKNLYLHCFETSSCYERPWTGGPGSWTVRLGPWAFRHGLVDSLGESFVSGYFINNVKVADLNATHFTSNNIPSCALLACTNIAVAKSSIIRFFANATDSIEKLMSDIAPPEIVY